MKQVPNIILILACVLAACGGEEKLVSFDKQLEHDNGLSVSRPQGFNDRKTEIGFVFSEIGERRTPRTLSVEKTDSRPDLTGAKERTLGGTIAHYTITDLGTGSGGTEYELKASKASGSGWIVMSEISQVEGDVPNFTIGWEVLERARLP
jgi:hypothetical protein